MINTKGQTCVSVIMNCYNGEKYLREAIDSVLEQTYENWELIIWDNQSIDKTSSIANSYDDKRIQYFLADKYTSLGEARNLAIKESKGEIIGFLDCDDLWLPGKLKKQVPLFQDQKVGIAICDTLFFNKRGTNKQLYKKKKPPTGMVFSELLSGYFISLETAMIRRQALDDLGYWFDTRFEVIEEYDLFVRLGYTWEVDYVDEVLAKWRVHASSWTWRKSEYFPKEKKLMLESLSNNIPNFLDYYQNEVKIFKISLVIEESMILWANGNKIQARKTIKPNINGNIKSQLLYYLMFLPFGFYKFLHRLKGTVHPA
jgi:glycosyltransferase involved in cell wall biosynthesis